MDEREVVNMRKILGLGGGVMGYVGRLMCEGEVTGHGQVTCP